MFDSSTIPKYQSTLLLKFLKYLSLASKIYFLSLALYLFYRKGQNEPFRKHKGLKGKKIKS